MRLRKIPGSLPGQRALSQWRLIQKSRCSTSMARPCESACAFRSEDRKSAFVSNEYGSAPVVIGAATVALPSDAASVKPGSIQALTFDGRSSVTIPVGAPMLSDPLPFPLPPGAEISISIYFPKRTAVPTGHWMALKRAAISQHGDYTRAEKIEGGAVTASSILLTAVLVPAQTSL